MDKLALIGHPLSDKKVIFHILNSLGDEYKELAIVIRARDSPMSFSKLINHKTCLK